MKPERYMHSWPAISWSISLPDVAEAAGDSLLCLLSLRCCSSFHSPLTVIVQQISVVFNCSKNLHCYSIPDDAFRYWEGPTRDVLASGSVVGR